MSINPLKRNALSHIFGETTDFRFVLPAEKCRESGAEKILVTCDRTNIASAKTAMKNGGVLENEFIEENGNIVQCYWITL